MDSPDGQDFVIVDSEDVEQYHSEEILPQTPEDLFKIKNWLQPTDYLADSSEYKKHLHSYLRGTGRWIQQTDAYQKWHDSPQHGALWTKAIAGAGKSVFAAMIAKKLASKEKVPVLFFFFRQIVATNHHPHSLARDFIAQLLDDSPLLQATMKNHMDNRHSIDGLSTSELWTDLTEALLSIPKVYCVVDALDEMDIDQESFFADLLSLGKQKPSSIKLLMTSRPLPRIEQVLKDPLVLQVRLEQRLVDRDIAVYVNHRLNQRADFDDDLRQAVKDEIGNKSQGSFLYARLMMDELTSHFNQMIPDIKFLQRSLDWLPVTLEDMYNGMLLDHSLRSRVPQHLQVTILRWVTHSSRPLRLLELATMLDSLNNEKGKDTKAIVRAACGPLLEILEDETVSVIHHSFMEFLTDSSREGRKAPRSVHPQFPVIGPPTTHRFLAVTCLHYLTSGCLSSWGVELREKHSDFYNQPSATQPSIHLEHPFLAYAVDNLCFHVKKLGSIDEGLRSMLDAFMQEDSHNFRAWLDLAWHRSSLEKTSPLHVAAWAGLSDYAKHLLELGHDCNAPDAQQRTPLSWAAGQGHTAVVALLLEHGSEPDSDDAVGLKPLHYSARANHYAVVKLLLDAGVSPLTGKTKEYPGRRCGSATTTKGHTPLLYACQSGNAETVREMMPYLQPEQLNTSLCTAAKSGRAQLVDLLLTSPDISVDPPDADDTPLFLASAGMHLEVMRSLLKKGANPMRRSNNRDIRRRFSSVRAADIGKNTDPGPTPFHAICGASKNAGQGIGTSDEDVLRKCFTLLLEAGCDINATDDEEKTPLHYSVAQGPYSKANNVLSKMLLENGADPMARDKVGNTPMHLVQFFEESAPTVEALVARGADILARRPMDRQTPLHSMAGSIHGLDLKVLLPHVTDWNIQDSDGNTPLHIILSKSFGQNGALEDLLGAGADIRVRNKKGEVPLHVVRDIRNSGKNVIPLLLKAGADLEAKDNEGRTILMRKLMRISENGDPASNAEVLLGFGSNVKTRDNEGNGVLHGACKGSVDSELLRLLIDAGANPLHVNNMGNNLLHEVSTHYMDHTEHRLRECTDLLMELGLSVNTRNHLGETPLHLVFGTCPTNFLANRRSPLEIFLAPPFRTLLHIQDNNGVLPLHLAATISEELVSILMHNGASTEVLTNEDRSVLHVAARARQSNIIGLILEHWSENGHSDMVNHPDCRGRTALHDACRSGRPESVALLLKAGADPNFKDKNEYTPLHACAEFEEEDRFWTSAAKTADRRYVRATSLLLSQTSRPALHDNSYLQQRGEVGMFTKVSQENHTPRIRDIIRLLVAHGADVDAMCQGSSFAIDLALNNGCEEMANELLPTLNNVYAKAKDEERPFFWRGNRGRYLFHEAYVTMRSKYLIGFLEEEVKSQNDMRFEVHRAHELLVLREFDALEQLPSMGVDFTPSSKPRQCPEDFLSVLVKWGYASILNVLGSTVKDSSWVNGVVNPENTNEYSVQPYLLTAANSRLPNLDVIKILVEKFGADVNTQPPRKTYRNGGGYDYPPGPTVLHVVARGSHWWHAEAIKYLLSKGASTEVRNQSGQTALHVAVGNGNFGSPHLRRVITQILLKHGADPNSMDNNGLTCLNKGIHDVELIRMLIKAGADITLGSKPVLFSAITAQDLPTIRTVLGAGADCNTRQNKPDKPQVMNGDRMQAHEYFPVHYAASYNFDKSQNRDTLISIIKVLLDHGADPYLQFRDDGCILHHLLGHTGILRPFLQIPSLELERRDPKGRTLLLAACSSSRGTDSPTNPHIVGFNATPYETRKNAATKDDPTAALTLFQMGADLTALDNDGNNALHLLALATPHNDDEYKKTFSLFLEKESSLITQKNKNGYTPYHYAVQKHRIWTARELVKAGANPLEQDPEGNTAFHFLAPAMCTDGLEHWAPTFKEFLSLSIDINAKDNRGETPLFGYFATAAARSSNNPARNHFSPFAEAGADVSAVNNKGEGLLHVVARRVYGNTNVHRENKQDVVDAFKFLMEMGLDPQMEDRDQRSALDVAAACGNMEVLELFKRNAGTTPVQAVQAAVDSDDDW